LETHHKNSATRISESILLTDLNELAHTLERELAMAARKVSIYRPGHPMARKALAKPFLILDWIFRFKQSVNVNIRKGDLHILNIRLKESVFNREIVRLMQTLDVDALLFRRGLSMSEFGLFVDRFVTRVDLSQSGNQLSHYLREAGIDTIEVNSERAFRMFETKKQYRGDVDGDFSVKAFVLQQLGDDLSWLAALDQSGGVGLEERGIDFNREIVHYLLPEKVASIPGGDFRSRLLELAAFEETDADQQEPGEVSAEYRAVYKLTAYHAERDSIVADLHGLPDQEDAAFSAAASDITAAGAIRLEVGDHVESLLKQMLTPEGGSQDVDEFGSAFLRLLKTGQRARAADLLPRLIDHLESTQPDIRQKALELVVHCIERLELDTDDSVFEKALGYVIDRLQQKKETFEYSELVWHLLQKSMRFDRFDLMARLTRSMAERRRVVDSVTIYDSMAVKQAFTNVNRVDIIDRLVEAMISADYRSSGHLREILISIGSEEVAVALSEIISHPRRQVRQQALKVLAELGKASLKVFTGILADGGMFIREPGRHELPDARWYVVRNTIFVLGSLKDPEGVASLRLRIGDSDVRVRREIIHALEKIGGEDACDLLIVMADDNDREIQESAVIAAGLIGTPEQVPLFIDVARRNPSLSVRVVGALGSLGGDESRYYLSELLGDSQALSALASGRVSKDDLRLAVIKALGIIGDRDSIDKIKEYQENLSTAQKVLFKNSPVSKAISEILSRR